jgi:hypothetical protein
MPVLLMKMLSNVLNYLYHVPFCPNYLYTAVHYIMQKQVDKSLFEHA